jgi:hypothetical protein
MQKFHNWLQKQHCQQRLQTWTQAHLSLLSYAATLLSVRLQHQGRSLVIIASLMRLLLHFNQRTDLHSCVAANQPKQPYVLLYFKQSLKQSY